MACISSALETIAANAAQRLGCPVTDGSACLFSSQLICFAVKSVAIAGPALT